MEGMNNVLDATGGFNPESYFISEFAQKYSNLILKFEEKHSILQRTKGNKAIEQFIQNEHKKYLSWFEALSDEAQKHIFRIHDDTDYFFKLVKDPEPDMIVNISDKAARFRFLGYLTTLVEKVNPDYKVSEEAPLPAPKNGLALNKGFKYKFILIVKGMFEAGYFDNANGLTQDEIFELFSAVVNYNSKNHLSTIPIKAINPGKEITEKIDLFFEERLKRN